MSLDIDPRYNPTVCVDIFDWEYHQYPPGYFSLITASPPCTEFSRAKTVGERDIAGASRIFLKTLEIIGYLQPQIWWLEIPRYGFLPKQDFMAHLPFWDVDYCQFGSEGFKKPTRIFGSTHLTGKTPSPFLRVSQQDQYAKLPIIFQDFQ